MSRRILYRNVRAHGQLELFLVSAVSGLLGVRFYLYMSGYPQVGGGTLHIAHMLWGGLLMVGAQLLMLSYLGSRVQRLAAGVGGVGFGIFIDELGKFITKDNNYFFQPTIGIIYAIFISLYLLINFLARRQHLSSQELQLNALAQLEEAVLQDFDPRERQRVQWLLTQADQTSPVTKHLQALLKSTETAPLDPPNRLRHWLMAAEKRYQRFWRQRHSNRTVQVFFIAEAIVFLLGVAYAAYGNLANITALVEHHSQSGMRLLSGQLVSAIVAAGFIIYGATCLPRNRTQAFEQFRRATLINLFLTEFFAFTRIQFGALPGFVFNLVLLGLISYARREESRR